MPDTEAGRALLGQVVVDDETLDDGEWTFPLDPGAAIAAIEREAAARALAEVRERVERLPGDFEDHIEREAIVSRAAVLAAIEEASRE